MYCDNDFVFCRSNADCPKVGTGRFLYYGKKDLNDRLYIHLSSTRETTLYCEYKQTDNGKNKYEYEVTLLMTEKELIEKNTQNNKNIFQELRANPTLSFNDWEERIGSLPFSEEIDFLNGIDKKIVLE